MKTIREVLGLAVGENLQEHRTYRIWKSARQRCYRINHHARSRYGGRGIKFCERWDDFLLFLEDMGHPPSDKHSLDRMDIDGDYTPENCKWSTVEEQNKNKSCSIFLDGVHLTHIAEQAGISYQKAWRRFKSGWTKDQIINPSLRKR
jgi:hypothetical protein